MKEILFTQRADTPHWVGDGFPARSIFSYRDIAKDISPFLLMDYLGPVEFAPSKSNHRLGVGEHPHRGFETVSIIYSGELEHRDSSGGGGVIRAGDVQWMTAGSGLVHEEFHGKEFSEKGGELHGVQIWVNLPKKFKMTKPKYQGIKKEDIPVVQLPNGAGNLRVIAGDYDGKKGPASTFTPINLWDIHLKAGRLVEFKVPVGQTAVVFVAHGLVAVNEAQSIGDAEIAVLERENDTFTLKATQDAELMFLGGEIIDEPILGYGPFVMNTSAEIAEAFQDYENGKMGVLGKLEGSE
ncbi:pirin family protein [Leptospira selangorensis]|uniref:pirin family protein n=1 Tax=Leptospira selangorensis TaxID=2484982 RepID=UPI0010842738|nr:pirin family protein [Leptospira selangorensis]TGK09810.1 pirin family protein [Leptospira selangorensis]